MFELGRISLKDDKYLIEKRNKIFDLAVDLGFREVDVTRLTTAISEVMRSIVGGSEKNGLELFIEERGGKFGLLVRFISVIDISGKSSVLKLVFDETNFSFSGNGKNILSAFKYIPVYSFKPTKDFLDREREKISRLTRDELFSELKKSYSNLKKEIVAHKETEKMLKKEKVRAEAANKAKSEFLASMSHEIRTPMNAIIGMTELLLDTSLSNEQKGFVQTLSKAGDALLALINDILDLSKIESGDVELEETDFDLAELIEGTCDVMAVRARKRNIEFLSRVEPDVPVNLIGDSG